MKALELLQNEIKRKALSHAYLLIGGSDSSIEKCVSLITEAKKIHPVDVSILRPDEGEGKRGEIKVEAVRELLHNVSLSSHGSGRLVVMYDCENLNQSSGNLLLKTLEEPTGNVIFLLCAGKDNVLSTIRSRCRVYKLQDNSRGTAVPEVDLEKIASQGFAKSSAYIEKIVKDEKVDDFLDELLGYAEEKMIQNEQWIAIVEKIVASRKRIANNVNARLVLENLALALEDAVRG